MAKKTTVKFFREDAPKPSKNSAGLIQLRTPVPLSMGILSPISMDMGLQCDHALLIGSSKIQLDKNFFMPGEKIVISGVSSNRDGIISFEAGEVVASAIPVMSFDFDIE